MLNGREQRRSGRRYAVAVSVVCALLAAAACEDRPPPTPDFAGEVTFDLGPPRDLPVPFGFDGNFLPVPDPAGTLAFSITDEAGAPLPSRVIFRPPPGSGFGDSLTDPLPDPDRRPGAGTGATVSPGVVGAPEGILLQTGWGSVAVPPGRYKLFVNRGPEYEAIEVEVEVKSGVTQAVNVELHRSVDTRGWLAADMHIHSVRSFDSRVPIDRRVISMVTSGIELLVPTEHHGSFSFAELIPELGYGPEIAGSVAGNELNFKEGHAGVYPIGLDPMLPRGGSPPYQTLNPSGFCDVPVLGTNCLTAADAFPLMRTLRQGGSLVTINHPWFGNQDLGYFTNIGWGAGTGGAFPSPLQVIGTFDAIELLNGYWTRPDAVAFILADWFYLLSTGARVTALGNSDTHRMNFVRSGWPRTWLRMPIDRPGEVTDQLLYDAIHNQRAIVSTGPFLTLEVENKQIGDVVVPAHHDEARIRITADAPSWMALDHVIVFVNGRERTRFEVPLDRRPRFTVDFTTSLTGDAFVVVLASGDTPLPADVVGEQATIDKKDTYPLAITNPVWIDADGDGVVTPPLLVSPMLPWSAPGGGPPGTSAMGRPRQHRLGNGVGAQGPAGRDCEPPRPSARETDHVDLDAMSDWLHEAAPLLYP